MASQAQSPFVRWNLSEEEILQGSILHFTQKQVIQNEISLAAEGLLALKFDPLNPSTFIQEQAFAQGKLEILKFLITQSDESEQILRTRMTSAESD